VFTTIVSHGSRLGSKPYFPFLSYWQVPAEWDIVSDAHTHDDKDRARYSICDCLEALRVYKDGAERADGVIGTKQSTKAALRLCLETSTSETGTSPLNIVMDYNGTWVVH
jgi:hypothetical protein